MNPEVPHATPLRERLPVEAAMKEKSPIKPGMTGGVGDVILPHSLQRLRRLLGDNGLDKRSRECRFCSLSCHKFSTQYIVTEKTAYFSVTPASFAN
jgi:hypothetical protein